MMPRNTILLGDAATRLRELPSAGVDLVVTSPPYFGMRNYGVGGQLGLEASVDEWVANLRAVMEEVARVLKPTGSLWLNLADSYSRHRRYGAPPKALLLGPERLLLALAADGWLLRNRVVWRKPNHLPTSVRDRLACAHEHVFVLVRQARGYYFDLDAIREPHRSHRPAARPRVVRPEPWRGPLSTSVRGLDRLHALGLSGHPLGKNPGDVWTIPTAPGYGREHPATFPPSLVERPILATCPERVCAACGVPWRRAKQADPEAWTAAGRVGTIAPSCSCDAAALPGLVLDPFFGSGTVGLVAQRHGRDFLGVELHERYAALARQRLGLGAPYERAA